ncbi:hypothetical protein FACS1894211_12880 [Clostridia bacterium]|nr:hypothetical protein FACS1894211_12880 [Clostridia bacterium]
MYAVVCGLLTALFLAWGVFGLRQSYIRAFNGVCDLGTSIAFYFTELLGFKGVVFPTVTVVPSLPAPEPPPAVLPETPEGFQSGWSKFLRLLISGDNVKGYFKTVFGTLNGVVMAIMFLLPFIVLFVVLFKRLLGRENNDYNEDTKHLRRIKRLAAVTYIPVKRWLGGLIAFCREYGGIVKLWVFLALLNFNVLTIMLEAVAYLFYLDAALSFGGFYIQIYKLFMDLGVTFRAAPRWAWFVGGYLLFLWLRRKMAFARLRHLEMRDRGFINSLPVVSMIVGTMGKRKTTMLTDMALSQEAMFRHEAFKRLLENDLKFPNFPWINLENDLKRAIQSGVVYNLATCRLFISDRKSDMTRAFKWCRKRGVVPRSGFHVGLLFGYDWARYGCEYDDRLKTVDIWDVLEVYAQLYFIYVIQSSLLIANYSIRTDGMITDAGNFPLWDDDFFRRDSRLQEAYSRHAHILDFDALRLGKKLVEDNERANAIEFGVIVITESGKERGNQFDTKGMSRKDDHANQKSDLFDMWLKMARHSATVDNYPFIRVLMDEQRPESMGADVRELCDIIHIRESSEKRLALPFFYLENLLYDFLFSRFERFYYEHRYARGDNTLTLYAAKKLVGGFHRYYSRVYNQFSFYVLDIEKERGTRDGACDAGEYFLMTKKIYARRFATDAFSDYFMMKSLRSQIGLSGLKEYVTERAGLAELESQNSYFINELQEHFK